MRGRGRLLGGSAASGKAALAARNPRAGCSTHPHHVSTATHHPSSGAKLRRRKNQTTGSAVRRGGTSPPRASTESAQATKRPHHHGPPTNRKQILMAAYVSRAGKNVSGIRPCGLGSPSLPRHLNLNLGPKQAELCSRHAEVAALSALPRRALTPRLLRRSTLVVARVGRGGTNTAGDLLCSRPCEHCAKLLERLGVGRVVFVDEQGACRRLRPTELVLQGNRASSGSRLQKRQLKR